MTSAWQATTVAPERTHHLIGSRALYTPRFEEVLSFHDPGLAAVRDGSGAYHVDMRGEPTYARRFRRTFGYYQGRATVEDASGAYHIDECGADVSPARRAWCGNFQGGLCAVRDLDGSYLHLRLDGEPAYSVRWRYAGDFREHAAVVQDDAGLLLHIDEAGRQFGSERFIDLDVFHKGFARARDRDGWFHLRRDGTPAYARRFAVIEPFYNGQARCELFGGAPVVIDERGRDVLRLRESLSLRRRATTSSSR